MTMVVTEPCRGCKDKSCIDVCPCECFHEGPDMLVIDPEDCIDCEACIPECPVDAIFHEDDVPEPWRHFIDFNKTKAREFPPAENK